MPQKLVKAELREIKWDKKQQAQEINSERTVEVQFNPETLKVSFSNQSAGGNQRGGSATQFVGTGTTKLSLDLWFDVTVPLPDGSTQKVDDVRRLTKKVAYFIEPTKVKKKWLPPGVRFIWGTFLFDGIMDSLNESLEFFSEDGKPLRARVSINLSSQRIQFEFSPQQPVSGSTRTPGTQPMKQAKDRDTVQAMAGPEKWKDVANANDIENPRRLTPGTPLNMNPAQ